MRLLLVALCFVCSPLFGDCIANGHYSLAASRFPYTEDLVRPGSKPVSNGLTIADSDEWTLIQTACSGATNVNASGAVNLAIHGSLRIEWTTATPEARFEVQFRLDGQPLETHTRRIGAHLPVSYRFGNVVENVASGNHTLSMWLRLRDPGSIYVALQWITAQGSPRTYPSAREHIDRAMLAESWTPIGNPLRTDVHGAVDASLQSSFIITRAEAPLMFVWTVDGESPGERFGLIAPPQTMPEGTTIFDHRSVPEGADTIRLWGRTASGTAEIENVESGFVSFPKVMPRMDISALADHMVNGETVVTTAGDDVQPGAMSPICGRWTKLLEFDLPPSPDDYSWMLDGFIEIIGHDAITGYGQIGMEVQTGSDVTDVGMFEFQAAESRDGIYFYGDCSKWGNNFGGSHVSLWIRRIEGCGVGPMGGGFVVGKRWLGVKLLPSQTPHVP